MIEYTVLEDSPWYMYHVDRQRGYETTCNGCGNDYGSRWPHGILLAVITDRSGSEQASTHNDDECIRLAVENLDTEDEEYDY